MSRYHDYNADARSSVKASGGSLTNNRLVPQFDLSALDSITSPDIRDDTLSNISCQDSVTYSELDDMFESNANFDDTESMKSGDLLQANVDAARTASFKSKSNKKNNDTQQPTPIPSSEFSRRLSDLRAEISFGFQVPQQDDDNLQTDVERRDVSDLSKCLSIDTFVQHKPLFQDSSLRVPSPRTEFITDVAGKAVVPVIDSRSPKSPKSPIRDHFQDVFESTNASLHYAENEIDEPEMVLSPIKRFRRRHEHRWSTLSSEDEGNDYDEGPGVYIEGPDRQNLQMISRSHLRSSFESLYERPKLHMENQIDEILSVEDEGISLSSSYHVDSKSEQIGQQISLEVQDTNDIFEKEKNRSLFSEEPCDMQMGSTPSLKRLSNASITSGDSKTQRSASVDATANTSFKHRLLLRRSSDGAIPSDSSSSTSLEESKLSVVFRPTEEPKEEKEDENVSSDYLRKSSIISIDISGEQGREIEIRSPKGKDERENNNSFLDKLRQASDPKRYSFPIKGAEDTLQENDSQDQLDSVGYSRSIIAEIPGKEITGTDIITVQSTKEKHLSEDISIKPVLDQRQFATEPLQENAVPEDSNEASDDQYQSSRTIKDKINFFEIESNPQTTLPVAPCEIRGVTTGPYEPRIVRQRSSEQPPDPDERAWFDNLNNNRPNFVASEPPNPDIIPGYMEIQPEYSDRFSRSTPPESSFSSMGANRSVRPLQARLFQSSTAPSQSKVTTDQVQRYSPLAQFSRDQINDISATGVTPKYPSTFCGDADAPSNSLHSYTPHQSRLHPVHDRIDDSASKQLGKEAKNGKGTAPSINNLRDGWGNKPDSAVVRLSIRQEGPGEQQNANSGVKESPNASGAGKTFSLQAQAVLAATEHFPPAKTRFTSGGSGYSVPDTVYSSRYERHDTNEEVPCGLSSVTGRVPIKENHIYHEIDRTEKRLNITRKASPVHSSNRESASSRLGKSTGSLDAAGRQFRIGVSNSKPTEQLVRPGSRQQYQHTGSGGPADYNCGRSADKETEDGMYGIDPSTNNRRDPNADSYGRSFALAGSRVNPNLSRATQRYEDKISSTKQATLASTNAVLSTNHSENPYYGSSVPRSVHPKDINSWRRGVDYALSQETAQYSSDEGSLTPVPTSPDPNDHRKISYRSRQQTSDYQDDHLKRNQYYPQDHRKSFPSVSSNSHTREYLGYAHSGSSRRDNESDQWITDAEREFKGRKPRKYMDDPVGEVERMYDELDLDAEDLLDRAEVRDFQVRVTESMARRRQLLASLSPKTTDDDTSSQLLPSCSASQLEDSVFTSPYSTLRSRATPTPPNYSRRRSPFPYKIRDDYAQRRADSYHQGEDVGSSTAGQYSSSHRSSFVSCASPQGRDSYPPQEDDMQFRRLQRGPKNPQSANGSGYYSSHSAGVLSSALQDGSRSHSSGTEHTRTSHPEAANDMAYRKIVRDPDTLGRRSNSPQNYIQPHHVQPFEGGKQNWWPYARVKVLKQRERDSPQRRKEDDSDSDSIL